MASALAGVTVGFFGCLLSSTDKQRHETFIVSFSLQTIKPKKSKDALSSALMMMHVYPWCFFWFLIRRTEAAEWWQTQWAQSLAFLFWDLVGTAGLMCIGFSFWIFPCCQAATSVLEIYFFIGFAVQDLLSFAVLSLVGLACGPASKLSGWAKWTEWIDTRVGHGLRWALAVEARAGAGRCLPARSSARCSDSQERK